MLGNVIPKSDSSIDVRQIQSPINGQKPILYLTVLLLLTCGILAHVGLMSYSLYLPEKNIVINITKMGDLQATIIHFNEVLTTSAQMAAFTGEMKWEERHSNYKLPLNEAIREIMILAPTNNAISASKSTYAANIALVEMEKRAFELIHKEKQQEALSLLISNEYMRLKAIYTESIEIYRAELRNIATADFERKRKNIISQIVFIAALIPVLIIGWIAVYRAIRKWKDVQANQNHFIEEQAIEIQNEEMESRVKNLEMTGHITNQVAHDFNNLLAPLMAYPGYIKKELPENHPALTFINDMEISANKLSEINQQLLTLGRRGHYNQTPLNLNEIIHQAIKGIEKQYENLTCEMNLDKDLRNIMGGATQISQALVNIINNAREAMGDNGTIYIESTNLQINDDSIGNASVPKGEYVKIAISDTGCGIPGEIIGNFLDPFHTPNCSDNIKGSGLGLSIVDTVIKDHSGYTDIKSEIGQGTTVFLYFPVTDKIIPSNQNQEIVGGSESILVADDDELQRQVTVHILERLGYTASAVGGGEEAIESLKETPQDLLLADMMMPPGIDGIETYQRILEFNPSQKAIIVSGYSEPFQVKKLRQLGSGVFIKKPLDREILANTIRKTLDEKENILV